MLVADSDAQVEEANLRMSRVGIEDARGYLAGGIGAWKKAGLPRSSTSQISAQELEKKLKAGHIQVLDVRREGEWQAGHITQARQYALDTFPQGLPAVDDSEPVAVHCKGGYRSMIACSLLERAGHGNILNLEGGFDAWHSAGLPEVAEHAVKA